MSDKITNTDDDGSGCSLFIGATIVGICIGNIYEPVYGWLVIGVVLILCSLTGRAK